MNKKETISNDIETLKEKVKPLLPESNGFTNKYLSATIHLLLDMKLLAKFDTADEALQSCFSTDA